MPAQQEFAFNSDAEKIFSEGLRYFGQHNLDSALICFDSLIRNHPINQRTTAAYVMAGKTLFELARYNQSASLLIRFIRAFPETHYTADARYSLALNYLVLQMYQDAAVQLLLTLEITPDTLLLVNGTLLFESIADEHLAVQNLRELIPMTSSRSTKNLSTLKLAEKLSALGESQQAKQIVDSMLAHPKSGTLEARLRSLSRSLARNGETKIGVVLPLMKGEGDGQIKSVAEDVLNGIVFAVKKFRQEHPEAVFPDLVVRDTRSDSTLAIQAVQELCGESEILGIVGPLFSNMASLCAPIAERDGVPLVSPTAVADGIAALGRHVFQASPDFRTRGAAMARYAVEQLGFSTLAVLAPDQPAGRALAQAFSDEVARLGAKVVAKEFYTKGASDLREEFVAIRRAGISVSGQKSSAESLAAPVTSIQGIYVPIADAGEIDVVAPQLMYYNLKTQILGSDEWYDREQLDRHRRTVDGVLFTSDWYVDPTDSITQELEKLREPGTDDSSTKYLLFGYDVMRLVLEQIASGATTREKFTDALNAVRGFRGLHSKITLVHGRVNSELHILRYSNGEIQDVLDLSTFD